MKAADFYTKEGYEVVWKLISGDPIDKPDDEEGASELRYSWNVLGGDFINAGSISTRIKRILQQIGANRDVIRRVAIASYEGEMNIVIHATKGEITLIVTPEQITVICDDDGPGIPDIELAMRPGFSTASDEIREMGFGAGMGLPNMKKCADVFNIYSVVGKGTKVEMVFRNE